MRVALFSLLALSTTSAFANTAIETETAQIGAQGDIGISNSIEGEHARDGRAAGTLTQFEYGITDRSEILIEPFFQLWEFPKDGPHEHGLGDLEITPSYEFILEDDWVPAVLIAAKVKVPTGDKNVGGTGKFDYFPYLIFGQHAAGWTFNANLGVNFAKPEEGGKFERTVVWDLEGEREIAPDFTIFAEVYNSEEDIDTISGALQYQVTKHANIFLATGYTEEHSTILRLGFNLEY